MMGTALCSSTPKYQPKLGEDRGRMLWIQTWKTGSNTPPVLARPAPGPPRSRSLRRRRAAYTYRAFRLPHAEPVERWVCALSSAEEAAAELPLLVAWSLPPTLSGRRSTLSAVNACTQKIHSTTRAL